MSSLPAADLVVLIVYLLAVVAFGLSFVRRSRSPAEFTSAGGRLRSWVVGLSLFGTYLSSNTFLGVPGSAYATNWNAFVFSLSLPIAASIAVRYFVPFYRSTGEISAYTHLERRFGRWARTYATVCYLLTQLARVGTILFGVALALSELTGWNVGAVILVTGVLVTLYTLLGGIEAVIWTDAVQSVVLIAGALLVTGLLFAGMPEGPGQLYEVARAAGKLSLGSAALDFTSSTIWVVLLYGVCINLNNFGIDQSFVQRYHTARSDADARRSVWIAAGLYLPVSLLFFVIGAGLFAHYQVFPEPGLVADRALPRFIASSLPAGVAGVVLAALTAAAMSSIDTSLNSSATVVLEDFYRAYRKRDVPAREAMRVLYFATAGFGALGTATALAMIGVQGLLSAWWTLSGVFAGAMLGLFLLGVFSTRTSRPEAMVGVAVGVLVILWMTLSPNLPEGSSLRSPLHAQMTTVVGTLTIFLVGAWGSRLSAR